MCDVSAREGGQLAVLVSDRSNGTSKGSAVRWDAEKARRLFAELREARPV
ncbi:hypothetical protein ACQPXS_00450 [Streptomyces sp. CA-142005]